MEYYMDEKWKVSKDEKNIGKSSSSSSSHMSRSVSQKSSTKNAYNLARSCSTKNSSSTKSSSSSLPRSSSQRCSEFTRKCSNVAKEQKAKFYIVKRCISMLVNWKKNGSDS